MELHSAKNASTKPYSSSEPLTRLFETSTRGIGAEIHHKKGTKVLWWKLSTFVYHDLRVMGSNPTYVKVACSCTAKSTMDEKLTRGVSETTAIEVSGKKNFTTLTIIVVEE